MLRMQTTSRSPARCEREARPPALRSDPRGKELRWAPASLAWRTMRAVWQFVRQASGDDAYERYREHILRVHADQPAMTRSEYYRFRTEQKWSRLTRCC
jgi:uncharacterized short protein YbdD (DUF466 family)